MGISRLLPGISISQSRSAIRPLHLLFKLKMAAVTGALRRLLKPSGGWTGATIWRASAVAGRCLSAAANGRKCTADAKPSVPRLHFSTSAARFVPAVTQRAPFFKGTAVVDGDFRELSLDDFKGKYLVLFFYPLDFTFVCPTEIIAFSDKANEFHDVNCEVVAVSVDSHFCHLAWINTPRKVEIMGLFIIDPNGIIKHLSVNDLSVGRSVEETLRLVKAFQYVETHGEVCPANWIPDSPTIKPNPEDSKEYFSKVHK
ncbi:putative Thioredoxin-dependent peroxide reductase protein [Naja naja]|nr:putative Thioredoxin-dependent peroxide reductase protein [Naja naja]